VPPSLGAAAMGRERTGISPSGWPAAPEAGIEVEYGAPTPRDWAAKSEDRLMIITAAIVNASVQLPVRLMLLSDDV
jgi:hypothetical protein